VRVAREPFPPPREIIDAIRATITEATTLRTLPPWAERASEPSVVPAGNFLASFSRMIPLPPAHLAMLDVWWASAAADERVVVGRRLILDAPRRGPHGLWRMRARLRSPWRVRSIPVEFWMWPYLDAWTKLNVEPQRGVRIGRRYFASGHRVIDALTETLIHDLPMRR
jgi:hypothetical protein